MRTFILNLYRNAYLRYMWRKIASKTHAQRRYDQLSSLIDNTNSVDNLYYYSTLVDEYEEKFGQEFFGDRYIASLNAKVARRERQLYRKLIDEIQLA